MDAQVRQAVLLLLGGTLGLLVAVTLGVRVLVRDGDRRPGRRALAHFLPVVCAAAVFCAMGRFEMALGLIFGTSVAALSTVTGFVCVAGPMDAPPRRFGQAWAMLPAVPLLLLVIGSRGYLSWFEAAIVFAQGTLVLWVFVGGGDDQSDESGEVAGAGRGALVVVGLTIVAAGLACGAAWMAMAGCVRMAEIEPRYSPGVMAGTLISIALALPMVSTGTPLSSRGRTEEALMGHMGVALLNLCVLLPAVIVLWAASRQVKWLGELMGLEAARADLPLPRAVWRIDLAALVVLSLVFLGAATGRLRLDRRTGGALILGYCLYLLATMAPGKLS